MKNALKGAAIALGLVSVASTASAQQKIGHINSQEVFVLTTDFKNAEAQLKTLGETKQKEYQGMVDLFNKKLQEGQEKQRNRSEANKEQIDTELQTIEKELQEMQSRVQQVQQVSQDEIGKKEQELMAPIQKKVMDAINLVAKEKGYAYILDLSQGSVIYFDAAEDISAAVKTKLGIQ